MAKTLTSLKNQIDLLGGYSLITYRLVEDYYTEKFSDYKNLRYPLELWHEHNDNVYKDAIELLLKSVERNEPLTSQEIPGVLEGFIS